MDLALRRAVRELGAADDRRRRGRLDHAGARAWASPTGVGSIEAGRRADLVVLDDDLASEAVMAGGRVDNVG